MDLNEADTQGLFKKRKTSHPGSFSLDIGNFLSPGQVFKGLDSTGFQGLDSYGFPRDFIVYTVKVEDILIISKLIFEA